MESKHSLPKIKAQYLLRCKLVISMQLSFGHRRRSPVLSKDEVKATCEHSRRDWRSKVTIITSVCFFYMHFLLVYIWKIHSHLARKPKLSSQILNVNKFYREIHHMCLLLGYGADAVCPYLVFETFSKLREEGNDLKISC